MRTLLLILALLLSMAVTVCQAQDEERCFYISSSTGSDENPGTEDMPFRTMASLNWGQRKNSTIRLKRGDVFFESLKNFKGCVIEAYGEGQKPVVCGFRVLKNVDAWESLGDGLWRLDMFKDDDFVGFPSELASDKKRFTDVGCIYDAKNDSIFGHILKSDTLLKEQGDIYLTDKFKKDEIEDETFRYLILKRESNPAELGNICLPVYEHGVYNMTDCIIKDIAVVGFGRHGMCILSGCTVRNCDIDIIGGSIQTRTSNWVRYGNGIEFWVDTTHKDNSLVEGCTIARTYDCGATIQGSPSDLVSPSNIRFVGNAFVRCRQAFEHFLNSSNTDPEYLDCEFVGNIAYMMGDNGFSSPEGRDANILSYEKEIRNLKITGNEFFGGNYYCGRLKPEGMTDNKVYIYQGQYLVHYHELKNFPTIYAQDENSINEFREKWGDMSEIIIISRGSKEEMQLKNYFLKRISYHVYDLNLESICK